ncbi:unnamed protein product, partial [Brassica oleracea var. botrytis]
ERGAVFRKQRKRNVDSVFRFFSLRRRKERGDRVDDESPRCSSSSILLIGGSPRRFFSSVALLFVSRLLIVKVNSIIVRKNFKGSWRTERTRRDSLFLYKEELQRILEKRSRKSNSEGTFDFFIWVLRGITGLWRQYTLGKKRSGLRSVFVETVHGFVTGLWRVHGFVV